MRMIHIKHGDHTGSTAFFRNRPLINTIIKLIKDNHIAPCSILYHACSLGAEPLTLAMYGHEAGLEMDIEATDIDPVFIEIANQGLYPAVVRDSFTDQENSFFNSVNNESITPHEKYRNMVKFLPACGVEEFQTDKNYDVVFLTNILNYLDRPRQRAILQAISHYNKRYLITTSFFPNTIISDLKKAGYEPVTTNLEAIHRSWYARIKIDNSLIVPPGANVTKLDIINSVVNQHAWALPAYELIQDDPDKNWKYCAIFKKKDA